MVSPYNSNGVPVTVVAADKTGTLTFGEMMVEKAWAARPNS